MCAAVLLISFISKPLAELQVNWFHFWFLGFILYRPKFPIQFLYSARPGNLSFRPRDVRVLDPAAVQFQGHLPLWGLLLQVNQNIIFKTGKGLFKTVWHWKNFLVLILINFDVPISIHFIIVFLQTLWFWQPVNFVNFVIIVDYVIYTCT